LSDTSGAIRLPAWLAADTTYSRVLSREEKAEWESFIRPRAGGRAGPLSSARSPDPESGSLRGEGDGGAVHYCVRMIEATPPPPVFFADGTSGSGTSRTSDGCFRSDDCTTYGPQRRSFRFH
jgi:hypothetical protein